MLWWFKDTLRRFTSLISSIFKFVKYPYSYTYGLVYLSIIKSTCHPVWLVGGASAVLMLLLWFSTCIASDLGHWLSKLCSILHCLCSSYTLFLVTWGHFGWKATTIIVLSTVCGDVYYSKMNFFDKCLPYYGFSI